MVRSPTSSACALKHYLEFTYAEARKRYDAGMTFEQAARNRQPVRPDGALAQGTSAGRARP
jgi:hypothetical protein